MSESIGTSAAGGWSAKSPGSVGSTTSRSGGEHRRRACSSCSYLLCRQGPLPAGIGVHQDQRRDVRRVTAIDLEQHRATPGAPREVRRPETEGLQQCREGRRRASARPKSSGRSEDLPAPGSSQATTVNSSDRSASCGAQMRLSSAAPWTRTKGAPTPSRWYAIVRPPVSTSCTPRTYSLSTPRTTPARLPSTGSGAVSSAPRRRRRPVRRPQ